MPDTLLSKLHIKSWLNDFDSEHNASRCRCASTPLYKDWLVASLINQVVSICALIMSSVSFFAGIADHITKGHQEYAKSLPGMYER